MILLYGVIVLLVSVYFYLTWINGYWKRKNVLHDEPYFLAGNFKDAFMGKKHFSLTYADLYRKFSDAPYVGYYNLTSTGIMLRDPELIKNILVKDFEHFSMNDFHIDKDIDPILYENIFFQTGEKWRKNRKQWTTSLTSSKLKALYDDVYDKCEKMVLHIKENNKNNNNEALEAKTIASKTFVSFVMNSIFRLKWNNFDDSRKGVDIVNAAMLSSFSDGLKIMLSSVAPKLSQLLRLKFISSKLEKELLTMAKEILDVRNNEDLKATNPFDSIIYNDFKDNISVTDSRVSGLVFNFLIDGSETSSGVGGFALYSLAANPDIQSKLRKELEDAEKEGHKRIPQEVLQQLPYLETIISETLRLYPPLLSMQKTCTKTYTLPAPQPGADPLTIEAGTPIAIPVYGIHMDSKYYPNPEKFDPDRFSVQNKDNLIKYTFLSFGEGPRVCPGMRLASNQLKVLISTIVRNFELRLAPKMIGKPITIDPSLFLYKNKDDLWLTFHELIK